MREFARRPGDQAEDLVFHLVEEDGEEPQDGAPEEEEPLLDVPTYRDGRNLT